VPPFSRAKLYCWELHEKDAEEGGEPVGRHSQNARYQKGFRLGNTCTYMISWEGTERYHVINPDELVILISSAPMSSL
jgi:hypothetical protein